MSLRSKPTPFQHTFPSKPTHFNLNVICKLKIMHSNFKNFKLRFKQFARNFYTIFLIDCPPLINTLNFCRFTILQNNCFVTSLLNAFNILHWNLCQSCMLNKTGYIRSKRFLDMILPQVQRTEKMLRLFLPLHTTI